MEWCKIVLPFVLSILNGIHVKCDMYVVCMNLKIRLGDEPTNGQTGLGKKSECLTCQQCHISHSRVIILLKLNKSVSVRSHTHHPPYNIMSSTLFAHISVQCIWMPCYCCFCFRTGVCVCVHWKQWPLLLFSLFLSLLMISFFHILLCSFFCRWCKIKIKHQCYSVCVYAFQIELFV